MALLFFATVVLPSLALAVLAYRAVESDRRLAEQAWRERLQDTTRSAYAGFERRAAEIRLRAEALSRGESTAPDTGTDLIDIVLSPELRLTPTHVFAWVPDGMLPSGPSLPRALEDAETQELRRPDAHDSASAYRALLRSAPEQWHGWIQLRLAQVLSRGGDDAGSSSALQRAANLPDAPGSTPSRFAARFQLAAGSPELSARLYQDLGAGEWLLEKSPYAYYEAQLREWAGGAIPPESLAAERRRQAMSRLVERVLNGESGWLSEDAVSVLVSMASHAREVAILTPETQWQRWLDEIAGSAPRDLAISAGDAPPPDETLTPRLSLATFGVPWSVWSEARDPVAAGRENDSRRRLLLAILVLVAGVLVFGSIATVGLVRRELAVARLQSDFAATVSHEFRSPLTGIRQLGEMLLAGRAAGDEPRLRHYYELICRESDRLTRLVDNVLDLSRIEDGRRQYRFERIETLAWLRGLAGIAAERRSLELDLPASLPAVEGDRDALSSAVLNLLDNAIKYSSDDSPVALRASEEAGWITIGVRDQGVGISTEDQLHMFDRFYQGHRDGSGRPKGVGLGLSLVKRIADAHGGRIRVESAPQQGSTFYLSLRATG